MGIFRLNSLSKERRIQMIAEFYDAIDSLKNREEVRLFFKDLLTPNEIATLMRRIEVAILLSGGYSYDQISGLLGVGRGKITNVQKSFLKDGNGYKLVVERLLENRERKLKIRKKREKIGISDFQKLKRKYPIHFLLNNLLDYVSEKLENDSVIKEEATLLTPSLASFGGGNRNKTALTNVDDKKIIIKNEKPNSTMY